MSGSESWDQFCLLAWKNWLLQKRKVTVTIVLLLFPIVLSLILLVLRSGIDSERVDSPTVFKSFSVSGLNYSYLKTRNGRSWRLAYTPKTALAERIMNRAAQYINVSTSPDVAYRTEKDLVERLINAPDVLGGVVFELGNGDSTLPKKISYKIRLRVDKLGSADDASGFRTYTAWHTNSMYPSSPGSGPRGGNSSYGGSDPGYYREGFLSIQRGIDLSIIQELNDSFDVESVQIRLKRHPLPKYIDDRFVSGVYPQLPLYIMASFMFLAAITCQEIVLEKEKKLRETMKLMGLKSTIHWISWFCKHLIFALISAALMTILYHVKTKRGAVINYSNGLITFIFLLLYSTAVITFCFAVSTGFSKASKGAAAATILFVGTYVPNFFIRNEDYQAMTTGAKFAASIDFNLAMAFGCVKMQQFEGIGTGLHWNNFARQYNADDGFTMLYVFIMLIFDIIFYSFLTYLFDMLLPGDFGTRRPLPCGSKENVIKYSNSQEADIPAERREYFEEQAADAKPGIKIRGLTKKFGKHSKPAVDNVNIDICEGDVTALLGHNGAGKSTTMFILTGFLPPSDGTAFIGGLDIRRDMIKIRRNLGFCPQQDVLFDRLTVKEHLKFFAKLKGCPSSEVDDRVHEMVELLGLEPKADKKSETLSGGMKRRLCLGIAFIFGSKIIILDEPTSGLDPQARRQAWDIVKSQQKGRTIILSTHFMDEADILGDRIAIMAAGQIQCYGSPLFLKKKYGIGYHMTIVKTTRCNVDHLLKVIKSKVPDARMESNVGAEVSFILPREQSGRFEKLFTQLEEDQEDLGIESFGASVTTMEEVFMKVGTAIDSTLETSLQRGHADLSEDGTKRSTFGVDFQKMTGRPLYLLQFQAMFVKRAICSWRNRAVSLFQILCPIGAAVVACLHVAMLSKASDLPALRLDLYHFQDPVTPYEISRNSTDPAASLNLKNCYVQALGNHGRLVNINEVPGRYSTMDDYLISVAGAGRDRYNQKYIIGGTTEANSGPNSSASLIGWFNNAGYHSIAISLSYATNAILDCSGNPGYRIETVNHPLPLSLQSKVERDIFRAQMTGFATAFILMLGMAFLLSIFVMFLIRERHLRAKHMQYVSGVGAANFWLATFAWDAVNYLIPALGIVVVFECFQVDGYTGDNNAGIAFMALIIYGWAAIPCIYILSFIFQVPASGLSWLLSMIVITDMGTETSIFVLSIPILKLQHVADALEWVFYVIFPNFCLGRAFQNLYINFKSREACESIDKSIDRKTFCRALAMFNQTNPCCPENCGSTCIPNSSNYFSWNEPGIGRSLVFMSLQGLVFFFVLAVVESGLLGGIKQSLEGRMANRIEAVRPTGHKTAASTAAGDASADFAETSPDDDDALGEKERVLNTPIADLLSTESVLLRDFTKVYGRFVAVSHLSVGIPSGQCFGLLGVNGAGKTTTFKMLTGDVRPTFGDAYVAGNSVIDDIAKVHHSIGYCPQFDALIDEMTVTETIWLYACLRGIPKSERDRVADMLIDLLMLKENAAKQCGALSGGNKRRLSVAVALVGNPAIVFLDEPTTGMDPTARRLLWNTLTDVYTGGRTLILSSHSMEECEALCTRLAIMVNGEFRCLGSIQHLKTKFNEGYSLIVKVRGSDVVDHEELVKRIDRVKEFVERNFPGSFLKDYHEGMLSYQVKTPGLSWSRIFGTIEEAKDGLDIEDYSVSQTTLEQLFVSFARKQREEL